jgi:hypothetical protein
MNLTKIFTNFPFCTLQSVQYTIDHHHKHLVWMATMNRKENHGSKTSHRLSSARRKRLEFSKKYGRGPRDELRRRSSMTSTTMTTTVLKCHNTDPRMLLRMVTVLLFGLYSTLLVVPYYFSTGLLSQLSLDTSRQATTKAAVAATNSKDHLHAIDSFSHPKAIPTKPTTSAKATTTTATTTTTDGISDKMQYWRFDTAAPTIYNARTHFLQSIPQKHRLPTGFQFDDDINTYLINKDHIWPRKIHLFETNPCIAVLPLQDRERLRSTLPVLHRQRQPVYVSSYRVTHLNNCFSPETTPQLFGGMSYDEIFRIKSDYLGIALLDRDLNLSRTLSFR